MGEEQSKLVDVPGGERRVVWPPDVKQITPLGYLRDQTGNWYPRDIGVSSQLSNGQVLLQWGDTFCHNQINDFIGMSNNNISVVPDNSHPTLSAYCHWKPHQNQDQAEPGETMMQEFIDRTPAEKAGSKGAKYKIWAFSGIVEYAEDANNIHGWAFFDMVKDIKGGQIGNYEYTSIARVSVNTSSTPPQISTTRIQNDKGLFGINDIRYGSVCSFAENGYLYAYGQGPDEHKQLFVSRVPLMEAENRSKYTFWTGAQWSPNIKDSKPLVDRIQQGQIWKTDMFGSKSAYKYAFIGCNSWADSKIQFGRSKKPQGPWEIKGLDVKTYPLARQFMGSFMYCMYPHPWAADSKKGDLMISWSEGGMTGGVIGVVVRLRTSTANLEEGG